MSMERSKVDRKQVRDTVPSVVRPFVKWAGGKRQLLKKLIDNCPATYGTYFEPFVGGGALFLTIHPPKAVISDINEELINAYRVIKTEPDRLIRSLCQRHNNAQDFYRVRAQDLLTLSPLTRASRFIYLNKTCYNGLYRENGRGQFNTPYGKYENPTIVDVSNIKSISAYLNERDTVILAGPYEFATMTAVKGDFLYFDPPYFPLTATASFTKYHKNDFNRRDQEELARLFSDLDHRGCRVMLSNSNTDFVRELYRDYQIIEVEATRAINCKANGRGRAANELLIKSW